MQHGKGHGSECSSLGNRPTCQLCGKYGHDVVDCWHKFDEHFTHTPTQFEALEFSDASTDKLKASTSNP